MKNANKTIASVLVLILAVALFVGAASAAEARPVLSGETAFVYENITVDSHGDGYLNFYDKDGVFVTSIAATNGGFNLLDVAVGSNTGIWYWNDTQGGAKGTTTVNIQYPSLSLDLRSKTSSMDGKSVVRGQEGLTFVIDAPYMTEKLGKLANVSILVTTPEGGKFNGIFDTSVSEKDLTDFNLTGVQTLIKDVSVPTTAQAGTYVLYAEFVLNNNGLFKEGTAMKDQYKKSASITVTVDTGDLDISIDKASVIRSNPFLATISGEAQKEYALVVEDGYDVNSGIFVPANQKDVLAPSGAASGWIANVKTDSSGKVVVQFDTTTGTDDKSYTIKVYGIDADGELQSGNYASASIKVEKGSVTASAPGDLIYYLGNEVDITGTNSDSPYVQIYYEGPNTGFTHLDDVSVKVDNSWEFKFDTSDKFNSKDGASYTFYFVGTNDKYSEATKITGSDALTDYEYATLSMTFKKPFVSATTSAAVVASGDEITISGTAEGKPSSVAYYIFGTNYYNAGTISVNDDSTFEKKIRIDNTRDAGQYYVVVEHPMENGVFDVHQAYLSTSGFYFNTLDALEKATGEKSGEYQNTILFIPQASYLGISTFSDSKATLLPNVEWVSDLDLAVRTSQASFIVDGSGKLQSSQAADTLGKNINDANIDDTYVKMNFNVVAPKITIDAIADQAVGSTFTISGTTNMAVDGEVLVQIQSSAFDALDKSQQAGNSGYTQTAKIVAGDGVDNVWSIEVDSTNWELDEYNVKAEVVGKSVSDTAKFNLVEKVVTPTATATATATTTATATATTAPTQTPGFGAFVALAGLGAVALLVLRRN